MLKIALAKGRLGKEALGILEKIGIKTNFSDDSRKLIFESTDGEITFFLAKPSDVPIFVDHGAADIGFVGLDTIMEENRDVYQVVDLGFGKCKFCVAGFKDKAELLKSSKVINVATKYSNSAKKYFLDTHRNVSIIKLNGSVELAPLVGLADVIFDIVESGKTLKENNLEVLETVSEISARMIVNKVSIKVKYQEIFTLINQIKEVIGE